MPTENEEVFYNVESVLAYRQQGEEEFYLIKWEGWDSSNNTWENKKNLNCEELMLSFWRDVEKQSSEKGGEKNQYIGRHIVRENYPLESKSWFEDLKAILSYTQIDGKFYYLLQWNNGFKTLHARETVDLKVPQMVIAYFESILSFESHI